MGGGLSDDSQGEEETTAQLTHNAVNKRRTMEARVNEMKEERKWKVGGKREWYD